MTMTEHSLAVDVGGTKVEAALVDDAGRLVPDSRARRVTGSTSSSAELEQAVTEAVAEALAAVQDGHRVVARASDRLAPSWVPVRLVRSKSIEVEQRGQIR